MDNSAIVNNTIHQTASILADSRATHAKDNLKTLAANKNEDAFDAAAKDFEAVFISQMLEHMFSGIETNAMFGGGKAENIYRSMMIQEYGKSIAASGGLGIANHVKTELINIQAQK